jgi:Fe-S cluster assembly protein SufD
MDLNQLIQNQSFSGPLAHLRKKSAQIFLERGLPTQKDEAWKYTSLGLLKTREMQLPKNQKPTGLAKEVRNHIVNQASALVFVDGYFSKQLSRFNKQKGLRLYQTQDLVQKSPERLKSFRAARKHSGVTTQDSVEALNAASFQSGVFVEVDQNALLSQTIQLVYLSTQKNTFIPVRNFVHVKQGAAVNLIETFVGQDGTSAYVNLVSEYLIEDKASLKWTVLQDESSQGVTTQQRRFYLHRESQLEALTIQTGAAVGRQDLSVYCLKPYAFARVNGAHLSSGEQVLDSHTTIDHVSGDCQTHQLYKYILSGSSRSVFDGFVRIREGAQKASSEQLNNNLLLSETAEADSKPNLMIYADDVKATHGSTVGRLDEDEIFYLQSRAISKAEARRMLALGFVTELLENLSNDHLREFLHHKISNTFERMESQ